MIRKIKAWWANHHSKPSARGIAGETYTQAEVRKLVEHSYAVGYNDGKTDGLAIARKQATQSLKEVLWQQNKRTTPRKQ